MSRGYTICFLADCRRSQALITPYLFIRVADPSSTPPLFATILLIIGVCQPGFILSWQCASSEGFWYRTETPPILTSSSAANLDLIAEGQPEMVERPGSAASSYYAFKKSHSTLPGIQPDGEDAVETRTGRVGELRLLSISLERQLTALSRAGRALSMVQPHPKLLILPSGTDTSSTSGAKTSQGHTRLRSLTLSKTVFGDDKKHRERSGSVSSRKTFAGFEMRSMSPMLVHRDDEAITRSLLATRKPTRPTSFVGTGRVPFGFGSANGASRSTPDLVAEKAKPAPMPSPSTTEFAFRTEDLTLPPLDSTAHSARSPPPDYTIDFLSSQILPRLVPSVVVGRSTLVDSEDAPLNRRRSSLGTTAELNATSAADISRPSSRASRNIRNLSLPDVLQCASFSSNKSKSPRAEDTWVSVDEEGKLEDREPVQRAKTPESVIASITSVVRGKAGAMGEDQSLRRRSWKDRTAKAWDRVEQKEQAEGMSSSRRVQLEAIEDEDPSFLRAPTSARRSSFGWSLDSPIAAEETEVLEEEGNVADESEGDDDEEAQQAEFEAHRRRRSVSPMSLPASPIHEQHFDESVVLRGSQFIDEDAEVGTVHCATIHPISRPGSDHSDLDSGLGYSLRPTHIPTGSLGSNRSLATSSITSVGFQNQLLTGIEYFEAFKSL